MDDGPNVQSTFVITFTNTTLYCLQKQHSPGPMTNFEPNFPILLSNMTLRAFISRNSILSYFTTPKSYFINYTIQFYNTSSILTFIFLFYSLEKYLLSTKIYNQKKKKSPLSSFFPHLSLFTVNKPKPQP